MFVLSILLDTLWHALMHFTVTFFYYYFCLNDRWKLSKGLDLHVLFVDIVHFDCTLLQTLSAYV